MAGYRRGALAALAVALGLSGCGWFTDLFEVDDVTPKLVTLHGTVAVPDGPMPYVVLSPTKWLAYQWYSCPEFNNDSALTNGVFLLESTNNCASAQIVYFYVDTPVDMTKYAQSKITFKAQANNAGQSLSLLVQDADGGVSNTVNLAGYGFDANSVGVAQSIAVPVTALTTGAGVNLAHMSRLFQLQVGCPAADCYTNLSEIRWTAPASSLAPFTPASLRSGPRCDPFPCKRLPHARVGIVRATPTGWTADPNVRVTTTDAEGNYSLVAATSTLTAGDGPLFVAVSDFEGTFTLLSTVAESLLKDGATPDVDVDRTTTAVSMLVCPNGMTIPSDGSGGYCIGDPVGTTELDTLGEKVDAALDTTSSPVLAEFWFEIAGDADVLAELNALLADHGLPAVSEATLENLGTTVNVPIVVPQPTNTGGTTGGSTTVGAQCQGAISCQNCSITACAAGTGESDCSAWYETSDGKRINCASCGDCSAAAQQATNYCCPTP